LKRTIKRFYDLIFIAITVFVYWKFICSESEISKKYKLKKY